MSTYLEDGDELAHNASHPQRRRFLTITTSVVGAVGVAGAAVPFVQSWKPSARARALAAPIRVDVSRLAPGRLVTESWAGRPVWILHRTPEMLANLETPDLIAGLRDPDSKVETQQPAYATNARRSIKPEYLVLVAICTHLGCVPSFFPDPDSQPAGQRWFGGYFCPCHGSSFDLAGRVFQSVPAPTNLVVPPHHYVDPTTIEIGRDAGDV